jgi:hypothetical protein
MSRLSFPSLRRPVGTYPRVRLRNRRKKIRQDWEINMTQNQSDYKSLSRPALMYGFIMCLICRQQHKTGESKNIKRGRFIPKINHPRIKFSCKQSYCLQMQSIIINPYFQLTERMIASLSSVHHLFFVGHYFINRTNIYVKFLLISFIFLLFYHIIKMIKIKSILVSNEFAKLYNRNFLILGWGYIEYWKSEWIDQRPDP